MIINLLATGKITHMEVTVHVEANDAKVIGAGDVGNYALSALPLLWHAHPHIPVPQLPQRNHMNMKCVRNERLLSDVLCSTTDSLLRLKQFKLWSKYCLRTFSGVGHLGSSSSL